MNVILYNRTGRVRVLKRLKKADAIREAVSWSTVSGNYASVRSSSGKLIGTAGYLPGEFRYEQ